jgi:hypothetical protein
MAHPRNDQTQVDALLENLATLYLDGNPYLGHYAWPWEEDRYLEMLVCALISTGISPEQSRAIVHILNELQIAGPRSLSESEDEAVQVIRQVLRRMGLTPDQVGASSRALHQTAATCIADWDGKPHVFLRREAERGVKTLAERFVASGMQATQAEALSTLWLQNVCNAPVLAVRGKAVMEYCKEIGIDASQLVKAADHVGLNVAIIDELLLMRQQETDSAAKPSEDSPSLTKSKRPARPTVTISRSVVSKKK